MVISRVVEDIDIGVDVSLEATAGRDMSLSVAFMFLDFYLPSQAKSWS